MSTDHTPSTQDVQEKIDRLEVALEQGRAAAKQTARAQLGVGATLGLIILGFVLANYVSLRSEWTNENFRDSLEAELRELSPTANRELGLLGQHVLPVYAEQGRLQLAAMRPEISTAFERELDTLAEQVLSSVHDQIAQSQERVLATAERALAESYPDLHERDRAELLARTFRAHTEATLAAAITRFDVKFGARVRELRDTVLQFDVTTPDTDTVELQKEFISLWLQLLNEEIAAL